jgi:hypothetical protein
MEIHCNYCNWIGQEPNVAAYETQEEFEEAYRQFRDSHDNPSVNTCPSTIK